MEKSKEIIDTTKAIRAYTVSNIISDFSEIPLNMKLTVLQATPEQFIKHREVGGNKIPYIDHFYAERCLNFITNFRWNSEKIDSSITKSERKGKTIYEATVEMNIWGYLGENKVQRYITSGHIMYENPAINQADCLMSAISKANTKFARQFGIGTDIIDKETIAYSNVEKVFEEGGKPEKDLDEDQFEKFLSNSNDYINRFKESINLTPEQKQRVDMRLEQVETGGAS